MNGLRVIHTGKLAGHDVSQPDLTELRQIHMRQTAAQDTSQPHMTELCLIPIRQTARHGTLSTTYDRITDNSRLATKPGAAPSRPDTNTLPLIRT